MATVEGLKSHIQFEDGMDDSMLSLYLSFAKDYVKGATGGESELLVYLVAGILYQYKIPETEMGNALNVLTPLFVQGAVLNIGETDGKQS